MRFFIYSTFNKITNCKRMMQFFNLHDSIVSKITQELWQLASSVLCDTENNFTCLLRVNMTQFVNNSLFGKNKPIQIAKRLSAIFLLTFKFAAYASFPWKLNRYSYGVQFGINCAALDQSKLSNFVECTTITQMHF